MTPGPTVLTKVFSHFCVESFYNELLLHAVFPLLRASPLLIHSSTYVKDLGNRCVELVYVHIRIQDLGSHRVSGVKRQDGLEVEVDQSVALPVDLNHRPAALAVFLEELRVLCQCGVFDSGCMGSLGI